MKFQYLMAALLAAPTAVAFQPVPAATTTATSLRSSTEFSDESVVTPRGELMSKAIPFLKTPPVLADSDLAGNFGFDPLQLAKNPEQLLDYREAEIKHARLAMLAAAGWPISEKLDRSLAEAVSAPSLLDDSDRVPSILNGGMEKVSPVWWGFCLGLSAAIDLYGVAKSRRDDPTYFPGNLGFDPLSLYPTDRLGQQRMQLAEIKHGRTAMMGVLGFVVEETVSKKGVIDDTPAFFQPITETLEAVLCDFSSSV